MTKHLHRLVAAAFAIVSLAGFSAPAMAAKHHHHRSHHGIAQHNRGDKDGDNNGGRDDRDGRV